MSRADRWESILEQMQGQDAKWKIPMPYLDTEHGIFVWALKAQEEMGELSAALLACIGHRKAPKDFALVECDQMIAVLLRIRDILTMEGAPEPGWCDLEGPVASTIASHCPDCGEPYHEEGELCRYKYETSGERRQRLHG